MLDLVALPADVVGPELLAVGVAPAEADVAAVEPALPDMGAPALPDAPVLPEAAVLAPDDADPVTETEGLAEGFRLQAGPSRR